MPGVMIEAMKATFGDLKRYSSPGNGLAPVPYSIRINDQYRICFVWTEQGPGEVEIVDYH